MLIRLIKWGSHNILMISPTDLCDMSIWHKLQVRNSFLVLITLTKIILKVKRHGQGHLMSTFITNIVKLAVFHLVTFILTLHIATNDILFLEVYR